MFSTSVLFIFSLAFYAPLTYSQNIGEPCGLRSGRTGICSSFNDCDLFLLSREQGQPVECSQDGILCCPTQNPVPQTVGTRPRAPNGRSKSYQKCMEYSRIKCESSGTPTIVNGTKVASLEEFPHMALLGYGDPNDPKWECGGSLISEQYILTAAHCLQTRDGAPVVAALGFLNKNNRKQTNGYQEFRIVDILKHPDRKPPSNYADIGLVKLDRPVRLSRTVLPVCIPDETTITVRQATATGWGDIYNGQSQGTADLMKVQLNLVSHSECSGFFQGNSRKLRLGILEDQQFCAGQQYEDTCQGDSGGPLQVYRTDIFCMQNIIGVTSFGIDCGKQPGVFTRVAHYRSWIESIAWP